MHLKVLRNSYNRIGGIIFPNIMSTTMTLTGQAVCRISPDAILASVGAEGLEPPELKHLIYSQARYQLRYTLPNIFKFVHVNNLTVLYNKLLSKIQKNFTKT